MFSLQCPTSELKLYPSLEITRPGVDGAGRADVVQITPCNNPDPVLIPHVRAGVIRMLLGIDGTKVRVLDAKWLKKSPPNEILPAQTRRSLDGVTSCEKHDVLILILGAKGMGDGHEPDAT